MSNSPISQDKNLQDIVIPDITSALFDYIEAFSNMKQEHIFLAPANRLSLPQQSNSFAFITILSSSPTSTNKKSLAYQEDTDTDIMTTATLAKFVVQIDVYGNDVHKCMKDMATLHTMWRDPMGYDFLAARHMNPLHVSAVRHGHEVDASKQFVHQCSADFTLCAWEYSKQQVETFSHISIQKFGNVDVLK